MVDNILICASILTCLQVVGNLIGSIKPFLNFAYFFNGLTFKSPVARISTAIFWKRLNKTKTSQQHLYLWNMQRKRSIQSIISHFSGNTYVIEIDCQVEECALSLFCLLRPIHARWG